MREDTLLAFESMSETKSQVFSVLQRVLSLQQQRRP